MKIPPNQHIPTGLTLSDEDLVQAARKHGSPMYLYDAAVARQRWQLLRSILPGDSTLFYSVKANPNVHVIDIFRQLGASCEVASAGEIASALRAGVASDRLIFVGPGKSRGELEYAMAQNLGMIVVESSSEIDLLVALSQTSGNSVRVALRVNPGRGSGRLSMGGTTQFGMGIDTTLALLKRFRRSNDVDVLGLHAYLGTSILDWRQIVENTRSILEMAEYLEQESGAEVRFIDVGGGFGIPYFDGESELDTSALARPLADVVHQYREKRSHRPTVAFESGRFLIGPAGIFVATVLDVKRRDDRCFVILDGGINAFGGEDYYRGFRPPPVRILCRDADGSEPVTLCGPLCTPADRLAVDTLLPPPRVGDVVAFYQAGAYRFTASPGLFLSHGFPCEVLVDGGRLSRIRERMVPEDFLRGQIAVPVSERLDPEPPFPQTQ